MHVTRNATGKKGNFTQKYFVELVAYRDVPNMLSVVLMFDVSRFRVLTFTDLDADLP